ncbi:MAG: glycosyltransferase [Chitinophagales bacterium]|nr:glycosyltransferase [Chitinophagales bacterium]
MRYLQEKVLIIIPCYNEEQRLNFQPFQLAPSNFFFLFVNDGSTDGTSALIRPRCSSNIHLYDLSQNQGKAEAVRQGFIQAKSLPFYHELDWVGYWDADLATPLSEIQQFLRYQEYFAPTAQAIFGSRIKRLGSRIIRNARRHFLGRLFATVVSNMFGLESYDTQCGAKLFRKELVDTISHEAFISKWAFDVEIILRLKGIEIVEYPLSYWEDVKGSKLNVAKTALRILGDLRKIRKQYKS